MGVSVCMSDGNVDQRCTVYVRPGTYLVREHHQPPVRLPAQDASDALRRVPHRVEAQELGLADAVRVSQVLQTRLEDPALRVLVWNAGGEERGRAAHVSGTSSCPSFTRRRRDTHPNMMTARP